MSDQHERRRRAAGVSLRTAPPIRWLAVGLILLAVQAGAVGSFAFGLLGDILSTLPTIGPVETLVAGVNATEQLVANLPTLLSRDVISNQGYWDGSQWVGTFMGLQPAVAWAVRVAAVYLYALIIVAWLVIGYRRYREQYRAADWTPRDDVFNRFRSHWWGLFGLFVVFLFVVMAVFAPTLGPTTVDENMRNSYENELQYWDADAEEVRTTPVGEANLDSQSRGNNDERVLPFQYDDYDRFHPFGTLPNGRDLFTFIAAGSRISLVIGILSVGLSATLAASLAMISAFYKNRIDLGVVLLSDAVMSMPQLLLLIMLTAVLSDTWLNEIYSGGFLLALIFAFTGWTYLWRSLRGPALQVAERQWVDAAKGFGQRPRTIMRKHILPYITGYLLIYGSMTLGGAIISIAGLSYLGLGVAPPTPEWGRAINLGQDYVRTGSWHISLIPGLLITLVVTGFNALGDGIRDAIDPQSDAETSGQAGRGGGA